MVRGVILLHVWRDLGYVHLPVEYDEGCRYTYALNAATGTGRVPAVYHTHSHLSRGRRMYVLLAHVRIEQHSECAEITASL